VPLHPVVSVRRTDMRIALIGAGISGMASAWFLEGGHARTITVVRNGIGVQVRNGHRVSCSRRSKHVVGLLTSSASSHGGFPPPHGGFGEDGHRLVLPPALGRPGPSNVSRSRGRSRSFYCGSIAHALDAT